MDPIEKRELKRRAWAKLAAQKRRAGLLRGRVVIASLICFALLWGVVFAQMATGNDPVLSAKSKTVATRPIKRVKKQLEKTETREVDPRRGRKQEEGASSSGGEEVEGDAGAEAEEVASTSEAEAVEAETAEAEAAEAAEIEAAEIAEIEAVEAESLVTSQS
jgi:non-ribosomal peptide synthetase component E (peptide arylation enzyme)